MQFKFELGDNVQLIMSRAIGVVISRTEFMRSESEYGVRYVTQAGTQVDQWFKESAIELPTYKVG